MKAPKADLRPGAIVAGVLAASSCVQPDPDARWATGKAAPGRFVVNADITRSVDLPSAKADFLSYMKAAGGDAVTPSKEEWQDLQKHTAGMPWVCEDAVRDAEAAQVIFFDFPNEEHFYPGYFAFLNADNEVHCVDKFFIYPNPTF